MGNAIKKHNKFVTWWLGLKNIYKVLIISGTVVVISTSVAIPIIILTSYHPPVIRNITSSNYPIFSYDNNDKKEFVPTKDNLKVHTINNSSVGYFDVNYYNETFLKNKNAKVYTFSFKDKTATLTNNFNSATCSINYNNQTIVYKNISSFFQSTKYNMPLIEIMGGSDYLFEKPVSQTSTFESGKEEVTIDLKKYHINAYFDDQTCYLPYSLCEVLFSNSQGKVPFFNGKNFYIYTFSNEEQYLAPLKVIRDSATIYNSEYMEYAYNALALSFDFKYGLDYKVWRSDNKAHTYFAGGAYSVLKDYKARLTSLKMNESNDALIELFDKVANDGGHGKYNNLTPLCDKTSSYKETGDNELVTQSYRDLYLTRKRMISSLPANQEGYYQEVKVDGKPTVAFLSIDSLFPPEDRPTPTSITEDNYYDSAETAVYWANKKIKENNIKNVVLDMSLNLGGSAAIAAFVVSWALHKPIDYKIRYVMDNSFIKGTIKPDTNLDGKFVEEDDYLPADVNLYCMSSYSTFSSGNYIVTLLNDFDVTNRIKYIGCNSCGGSCNVYQGVNNPLGSSMSFSGIYSLQRYNSTKDHIINDEEGITKPFTYPISCYGNDKDCDKYYNRSELVKWILDK